MEASELATLLGAKRVGKGKWMALCPAHSDRNRSLSIDVGDKRKSQWPFVLNCRSHGCSGDSILKAIGLSWKDVKGDKESDPRKLRELEDKRKQEEAKRKQERHRQHLIIEQCRLWERKYYDLAKELAVNDNPRTALQFHDALSRFRALESQVNPILFPKGV